jgi:hypothetical protein
VNPSYILRRGLNVTIADVLDPVWWNYSSKERRTMCSPWLRSYGGRHHRGEREVRGHNVR